MRGLEAAGQSGHRREEEVGRGGQREQTGEVGACN